jgi:hypothetical protein
MLSLLLLMVVLVLMGIKWLWLLKVGRIVISTCTVAQRQSRLVDVLGIVTRVSLLRVLLVRPSSFIGVRRPIEGGRGLVGGQILVLLILLRLVLLLLLRINTAVARLTDMA